MFGKRAAVVAAALMTTGVYVGGTAGAAGSTLNVCPSGCPYTSIQDAVDDAESGDTIQVGAGTYAETVHVDTPNLTIDGAGPSQVTLDATGFSSTRGLTAQADGFTLRGLTVLGPDDGSTSSTDYGVKVEIDDEAAITDVVLENLVVEGSGKSEIDLHGVENARLADLTLDGQGTSGNGLAFTDSHDIHVDDVGTTGNTWGGIAFYTSGQYTGEALTSNITVTGYTQHTEANPVYLQGDPGTFEDIETVGFPVHLAYGNNEDFTFRQPSVDAALDAAVSFAASDRFDLDTATVEDTRDGSLHTTDGMSLQTAADAADPGDEIVAHGGTYDEAVTVDTGVTIVAQDDATVTDTVTVAADGVTLQDLHVAPTGNWWNHGIDVDGEIQDLRLDGTTVTGDFMGLWIGGEHGVDGLTITDALFDGNRIGLYTQHDPNLIGDVADLRNVTDVTVENTTFLDNVRKGIYAETLSNAVLEDVTVSGITSDTYGFNDGIDINLKAGDYSDIRVADTVVEGVSEGDPGNQWTPDLPAFSAAIAVKARDDPSSYDDHPATLDGVTFENVTVRDSFNGLRIGEPGVDYTNSDAPTNVTVRFSTFANNERYGFINEAETVVDASHNWWASEAGPTLNETTSQLTGERVRGPVDVAPFCLQPGCAANAAVHGSPVPHASAGAPVVDLAS